MIVFSNIDIDPELTLEKVDVIGQNEMSVRKTGSDFRSLPISIFPWITFILYRITL